MKILYLCALKMVGVGVVFLLCLPYDTFGQHSSEVDSLKKVVSTGSDTSRLKAMTKLTWLYAYSQADSALTYGLKAVKLAESLNKSRQRTSALNALGATYITLGGYAQALEYFLEVRLLHEREGSKKRIARDLVNISVVFAEQSNHARARDYLREALSIAREVGDTLNVITIHANLANSFFDQEEFTQSIQHAHQALNWIKDAEHTTAAAMVTGLLGLSYAARQQYAQALHHLRRSLRASQQIDATSLQASALQGIAEVHLGKQQLDSAIAYAKDGLELAQNSRSVSETIDILILLSRIYQTTENHQPALRYYQRAAALKDSIFDETSAKQVAQMQTLYETQKKERAIETLQKEKALQRAEMDKERNLRYGILAAVVLLLGLLAVLYSRYRLKQRALQTISAQKDRIEHQNAVITDKNRENEVLLREIHHRVKNNLQLILSLLNIQSRQFDDEAVLNFVRDGQNRVRSMALIHQDLYQAKRLDCIRFDHYLKQLADHLRTVYQAERRSIFIRLQAEPTQLDVNTAVPLGLIVNELVSNALKHAFSDTVGQVDVVLATSAEHRCQLTIADNGTGFTEAGQTGSMGLKLVYGLVQQLGGTLRVSTETGSRFEITFSAKPLARDYSEPAVNASPSAGTSVS